MITKLTLGDKTNIYFSMFSVKVNNFYPIVVRYDFTVYTV